MKLDESLEYFHYHFLGFCYEFLEDDIDWDFMKEKFHYLVQIYLNPLESASLISLPSFLGHGALKDSKEEYNISCDSSSSFVSSSNKATPCTNVEVGKLEDQRVDPPLCPPSPHKKIMDM